MLVQQKPQMPHKPPSQEQIVRMQQLDAGVMRSLAIQAKLAIGASGKKYEQEADQVAAHVVEQLNAPLVQQQLIQQQGIPEEKDKALQMKPLQRQGAMNDQSGELDEEQIRQEMATMSPLNGDRSGSELMPEPKGSANHAQADQIKQSLQTSAPAQDDETKIQTQIDADTIQMARDYSVCPWPFEDTEYCVVEVAEGQEWATDLIKGSAAGTGAFQFQNQASGSLASESSFYAHFTSPGGNQGNWGYARSPSKFSLTSQMTNAGGTGQWSAVHGCTFGSDIEATHSFNVHEPIESISEPTTSAPMYDFLGAVPFQLEGIGEMTIKLSQAHIRNTGFTAQRSFGTVSTVQQAHSFGLDLVPTASIGPISAGGGASFGWSTESSDSLESKIEGTQSIQSANTVTSWQEDKIQNTSEDEKQSWMVLPEYVWKEWTVNAMPHNPETLQKTGDYTTSKIGGLFATGHFQRVRSDDPTLATGGQDPNLHRDPTGSAIPSTGDFGEGSELADQARAANAQAAGYQTVDPSFVTDTDHVQFMKLVDHKPAARDYQAQFGKAIPSGRGSTAVGGSVSHQVSEGYAVASSRNQADGATSSSNTNIGGAIAGIGDSLSFSNTSSAVNTTGQTLTQASGGSATTTWEWSTTVSQKEGQRQFQVITPLCRLQTWEVLHGCRQQGDTPSPNDFQKAYLVTVKSHVVPHSHLQDIEVGEDIPVGLPNPFIV